MERQFRNLHSQISRLDSGSRVMINHRVHMFLCTALLAGYSLGCQSPARSFSEYQSTDVNHFRRIVNSSCHHGVAAWFYVGSDDTWNYFVCQYYPLQFFQALCCNPCFRVSREQLMVPDSFNRSYRPYLSSSIRPIFARAMPRAREEDKAPTNRCFDIDERGEKN